MGNIINKSVNVLFSVIRDMTSLKVHEVMYSDYFPYDDNNDSLDHTNEERRFSSHQISSGMSVTNFEWLENELIFNEFSGENSTPLGQVIVVDSGCPRSLMGEEELEKLRHKVDVEMIKVKEESFRFGPSRIYTSRKKARLTIQCGLNELDLEFFVIMDMSRFY